MFSFTTRFLIIGQVAALFSLIVSAAGKDDIAKVLFAVVPIDVAAFLICGSMRRLR
jgi:uncharacterized membrane protein YtjA (UPF0391 family)